MSIRVETFKKSGTFQCHDWQKFGHGSLNCGHQTHCVKCGKSHLNKDCIKTCDQSPCCVNCGECLTASYWGFRYYQHILETSTPKTSSNKNERTSSHQVPPTKISHQPQFQSGARMYAKVISDSHSDTQSQSGKLSPSKVLNLLKDLLQTISTTDDTKEQVLNTIFIIILSSMMNNNPFKIISWNANGVRNKLKELPSKPF